MADHWSHEEFRVGACCPISGIELAEVLSTHPHGHPLAGDPAKIGRVLPEARVVILLLTDGSTMDLTVHQDYVDQVHDRLPEIWRKLKASTRRLRKAHRALGQKPFTPEQTEFADRDNCRVNDNLPLGVLCVAQWSDIHG